MSPAPATDIRDAPAYTFLAAARHLGMPQATLRYWVQGRTLGRGEGSAEDLAWDYGLEVTQIEDAVLYERAA